MEIELKYLVKDEELADSIFSDEYLLKHMDKNSYEVIPMRAVYFDTDDDDFMQNRIAFRVRREGDAMIGTLKWNGTSEEGMHKREELNVPIADESYIDKPDLGIFEQSDVYEILKTAAGDKPIKAVMEMEFDRRQMRIDTGKSISELSVDKGQIKCCGKAAEISELELELYSGSEEDVRALGKYVSDKYGLQAEDKSKFQRGLELR